MYNNLHFNNFKKKLVTFMTLKNSRKFECKDGLFLSENKINIKYQKIILQFIKYTYRKNHAHFPRATPNW